MQDPQPKVEYDDLGRYVDIHDYVYEEREDTDLAVAEFAKGAWQFVYETKDDEPEPKPRVFASIRDVPPGVVVSDRDGYRFAIDRWNGTLYHLVRDSRYSWLHMDLDEVDGALAPFTEVLDA